MARIAGVDLPQAKRIEVGLTYIFGIGPPVRQTCCKHPALAQTLA